MSYSAIWTNVKHDLPGCQRLLDSPGIRGGHTSSCSSHHLRFIPCYLWGVSSKNPPEIDGDQNKIDFLWYFQDNCFLNDFERLSLIFQRLLKETFLVLHLLGQRKNYDYYTIFRIFVKESQLKYERFGPNQFLLMALNIESCLHASFF